MHRRSAITQVITFILQLGYLGITKGIMLGITTTGPKSGAFVVDSGFPNVSDSVPSHSMLN